MRRMRAAWAATGWVAGFALAGWALAILGRLDWMRVDWTDPLRWLRATETEAAVAALARLAGLTVVGWVLGSSLMYALGRILGWRRSPLQWLSIGPIRRAVDTLVAGSLLVSTMAPAAALVDPGTVPSGTEPVEFVDSGYLPGPVYVPTPAGPEAETSLGGSTPAAPAAHPPPALPEPGVPGAPVAGSPETTGPADTGPEEVTVGPGDSFWTVAARHLETIRGHSPTDAEIAPYWTRMVEVNRDRIRSGDPDLIFPGEVLILPPAESGR